MLMPDDKKKIQFPRNMKQLTLLAVIMPISLSCSIILYWWVQTTNPNILSSISIYYSVFLFILIYLFVWGFIPITIQHYKRLLRDTDMKPNKRRLRQLVVFQCFLLLPTTYFFISFFLLIL